MTEEEYSRLATSLRRLRGLQACEVWDGDWMEALQEALSEGMLEPVLEAAQAYLDEQETPEQREAWKAAMVFKKDLDKP